MKGGRYSVSRLKVLWFVLFLRSYALETTIFQFNAIPSVIPGSNLNKCRSNLNKCTALFYGVKVVKNRCFRVLKQAFLLHFWLLIIAIIYYYRKHLCHFCIRMVSLFTTFDLFIRLKRMNCTTFGGVL
jgi:hypothetical protein